MTRFITACAFIAAWLPLSAASLAERFHKTDVMIPMRDGVRLHTEIYAPSNAPAPLPFLITRTPYGQNLDKQGYNLMLDRYEELARDGYIFIFQDIRGRHASEGQFVMLRPPRDRADARAVDESTDAWDTVAWLLTNVPHHNGRAGMLGISYGGWLTVMAAIDPHPALKAVSEQASPADMWMGDDFHHNGAFRLSYGLEYSVEMETSKTNTAVNFDTFDTFEWYLKLGPLANFARKYGGGKLPTWNAFVEHPNYDEFWRRQSVTPYLKTAAVPNLNVAGWFDQEDFYGPMKIYEELEKHDSDHRNFLVVGPWNHGGWSKGDGQKLGRIDFGSETAAYFRQNVQAPWFAYWLKDQGKMDFPEALVFATGTNRWERYPEWPPAHGVERRNLYVHADGGLSFSAPKREGDGEFDGFTSDPMHPVPYRQRPIDTTYPGQAWKEWLVEDQRFVDRRPDVLTWSTEVLANDVSVAGDIVAHLFASTSGTDSDWIVKLIDVYPEKAGPELGGYELMIAGEVLRGRYRRGFEKPEPAEPGAVNEYTIDLHTNDHCFLKGHRIMVQVQSTWFPLIDRNPQKFIANIFMAGDQDYQTALHKVYRSRRWASYVELPVIRTGGGQ
ncbi:MAG: CocE/NonD family hydrolase [Acidobacteriota bacterium]|nr:CocE/NonD family hydrolase [Acidobacteriota bacterium]